jgi:peptide/nickel transport system substrate-binding protein
MKTSLAIAAKVAAAVLLAQPAHATTLKVGVGQGLVNPDPHTSSLYSDVRILEQIYQGLMRLDPTTLKPVGDLADSWTISDDKLTWTFKLHPGVKFHDGRALSAADVVYWFNHIRDPKTVATLLSDFEPIASVDAPDPATVVLKLKRPYGVLPAVLATPVWAAIVPANAGDLAAHPVGTGPFEFVSQVA